MYFRIENCNKNDQGNNIHPGVDNGIWFQLRFPTVTTSLSLPTSGWTQFPSRQIPPVFSMRIIQEYLNKYNAYSTDSVDSDSENEKDANNIISATHVQGQLKSWRRGRISFISGHVQKLQYNNDHVLLS